MAKIRHTICVTVFHVLLFRTITSYDIRLPPVIVEAPTAPAPFKLGAYVLLKCKAQGIPSPRIAWERKYKTGEMQPNNQKTDLFIRVTTRNDNGLYRCKASNQHGQTYSSWVRVQAAELTVIPASRAKEITVNVGQSLVLVCPQMRSVPQAQIRWIKRALHRNGTVEEVEVQSQKGIFIAQDGTLCISYVTSDLADVLDLKFWCKIKNSVARQEKEGPEIKVDVLRESRPRSHPMIIYSTKGLINTSKVEAKVGQPTRIQCAFNGSLLMEIFWSRGGQALNMDRYVLKDGGHTLWMRNVSLQDEGDYSCCVGEGYCHTIKLTTVMAPVFTIRPQSVNVTEGGQAVFTCKAKGKSEPNILWHHNGTPLFSNQLPSRYELSKDGTVLTIRDVCGGDDVTRCASDVMSIQCHAQNDVTDSLTVTDAYLNVLRPTHITKGPADAYVTGYKCINGGFLIPCEGNSDPSTPLRATWWFNNKLVEGSSNLLTTNADNSLTLKMKPDSPGELSEKLLGTYMCRISNGYSSDNQSVVISNTSLATLITSYDIQNEEMMAPDDVTVAPEADHVTITCPLARAATCRQIKIKWSKENQELNLTKQKEYSILENQSLLIRPGDPGSWAEYLGNYSCMMAMEGGENNTIDLLLSLQTISSNTEKLEHLPFGKDSQILVFLMYGFIGFITLVFTLLSCCVCKYVRRRSSFGDSMFESWNSPSSSMIMRRDHQPLSRLRLPTHSRTSELFKSTLLTPDIDVVYEEISNCSRSPNHPRPPSIMSESGYLKPCVTIMGFQLDDKASELPSPSNSALTGTAAMPSSRMQQQVAQQIVRTKVPSGVEEWELSSNPSNFRNKPLPQVPEEPQNSADPADHWRVKTNANTSAYSMERFQENTDGHNNPDYEDRMEPCRLTGIMRVQCQKKVM